MSGEVLRCVWEHNGSDSLIYAMDLPGVFARGASKEEALGKLTADAAVYSRWLGGSPRDFLSLEIVQEKASALNICDADSDVLFDAERLPLDRRIYEEMKSRVLKSSRDFQALYDAVPDKDTSVLPRRETFYGQVPCTAREMYEHTKNVNAYYFGEIGVEADNRGDITECRARGFVRLEDRSNFLQNPVVLGSYDEEWSLGKVLRRFLWHDRIHARAMFRMAQRTFGPDAVPDLFRFES